MTRTRERVAPLLLVALLVAAPVVGVLAVEPARAADAAPSGMVTVADDQITTDVPASASIPVTAAELRGNVLASDHADTLEVTLTTESRAADRMGSRKAALRGDGMALVLADSTHHSGRKVAIDAGLLKDALGRTPEMIYGYHEDGSRWSRPATYRDGFLILEIPHFSQNTIEFSGTVDVSGTYSNGSSVAYDLADLDAASDPTITLTGAINSETDNDSWSGTSSTVSFAGSKAPTGPDGSGDPVVGIYAESNSVQKDVSGVDSVTFSSVSGVSSFEYSLGQDTGADSSSETVTVEAWVDGSKIGSEDVTLASDTTQDIDNPFGVTNTNVGSSAELRVVASGGSTTDSEVYLTGYQIAHNDPPSDPSVSVSNGGSATISGYSAGSWSTVAVDAPLGDETVSVNAVTGTNWQMYADYTEKTETVDPAVSVNGKQVASYSGTLASGSTATYTANSSVLQSGTNTIDVTTGTVSSDAPPPVVGLDYTHDATDKQSVNYTATEWKESYNVSKTFASDRSSATLTIPFEGSVISIASIEKSVNGGAYQAVSSGSYSLNSTTLTVDLGSVAAGDSVSVWTTARMVAVTGGSITVTDPTVRGERLDSKIRLDSWSSDAHIGVGGTPDGRRIHYAYSNGYSTAEYEIIKANGANQIYLPSASAGNELRVSTIPVKANPETGEVRLEVSEPRTSEPQFTVREGPDAGDPVSYTYVDATDGEKYLLYSQTNELVRDSGTANSPITLEDDDSAETLEFRIENTSSSDSSGGGGGIIAVGGGSDSILGPAVLAIVGIAGIGLVMVLRSRFGGSTSTSRSSSSRAAAGARRAVGGVGARLRGLVARIPAIGGLLASLLGVLTGVLATVASPVASAAASLLGRRDVLAVLGVVGIVALLRYNILIVPRRLVTLGGLAVVLVGVLVALRRLGVFSLRVYLPLVAVIAVMGAELIRPGSILGPLGEGLGSYVPILGLGALYIAYKAIQARQGPEKVVRFNLGGGDES